MKLASASQMQEIDARAITECKIPSMLLMEHAALSIFKQITSTFEYEGQKILIVCGPGNNGGDGFALARQLAIWTKHTVVILFLAETNKLSDDGNLYYEMCQNIGVTCVQTSDLEQIECLTKSSDIIVDAIFGTGLKRKITGIFRECILYINNSNKYIISADIPSGIEAGSGKVLGVAVKANITVTFELPKIGLYVYPGIDYAGKVEVVKIGIPEWVIQQAPINIYSIDSIYVKDKILPRATRSNKGTYGKALLIGGKRGLSGAITLSAMGCIKVGAGLVAAAVPECIHDIMEQKLTEVMTYPLPCENGELSLDASSSLKAILPNYTVVAFGPGIGRNNSIEKLLKNVLEIQMPCIIDADGLYALKELLPFLKERTAPTVITPHPGEMSRLVNKNIDEILENGIEIARNFALEYGITVVLKTERTIVAWPNGEIYVNTTGNPGMAKGGSGDVLTGIITGLVAQNLNITEAAVTGVYLHGRAGDIMAAKKGIYTMLPSDLYEGLECSLKEINNYII